MNAQAPTPHHTSPIDAPESAAPIPPQNPTKKRPLEASAAEFLERGWKLVESVEPKKDHPYALLKDVPIGEPKGKYIYLL